MLKESVQSSLDQLLHVVEKGNVSEKICFYYIFENNDSDNSENEPKELALEVTARNNNVGFSFVYGSNEIVEKNSDRTIMLAVDDMSHEFLEIIKMLCNKAGSSSFSGRSSIHVECHRMYYKIYEIFLKIIYRNCMKNSQITAEKLMNLRHPLWLAVLIGNAEVIENMIIRGCPINTHHTSSKVTALIRAVQCMNLEIVKVLIKYDVDVDLANAYGLLPIAFYGSHESMIVEQPEIIEILLSKSIVLKSMPGKKLLIQFKKAFEHGKKKVVQMLLEYREDILNHRDENGQTPLHYLARNRHSDITELLEGRIVDVNVRDNYGWTPLYTAANNSYSHINTFKFLLRNGADVNDTIEDEFYKQPFFMLFCGQNGFSPPKNCHLEIIELFLEHNLDIQFVGSSSTTILDLLRPSELIYIAEPFLARLAILNELNQPIIDCIWDKIDSNELFKNYFNLCKTELKNLKNNAPNQKINLYTILVNSEQTILKFCKYHSNSLLMVSLLEKLKNQYHSDHVYYDSMIKKRISRIVKSIKLYQKAAPILCKLLGSKIDTNHLVLLELANYLNDKDLELIEKMDIAYAVYRKKFDSLVHEEKRLCTERAYKL